MIMEESYNLLSELEPPEHMVSLQSTSEGLRTKKANDENPNPRVPSFLCLSLYADPSVDYVIPACLGVWNSWARRHAVRRA